MLHTIYMTADYIYTLMSKDIIHDSELRSCEPIYSSANRYLEFLVVRNRTPSTIKTYRSILRTLIRALVEIKGPNMSLEDITDEDIFALIRDNRLKGATMKQKLCVLGSWMEYELGSEPIKRMRLLWNKEDICRRFLTLDQFNIIYSYTTSDLERLVLLMGAELGMRRHEIVSVNIRDIHKGKITIHGKGHNTSGKEAVKTIPNRTATMIVRYMCRERSEFVVGTTDRLLIQNSKCKHPGEPVTDSTLDKMCERLSKRSGIKFSPHDLRRLYCMTLARECDLGNDLDTLRRMMRHESIDTTLKCYLDVVPDKITEAENKLNEVMRINSEDDQVVEKKKSPSSR